MVVKRKLVSLGIMEGYFSRKTFLKILLSDHQLLHFRFLVIYGSKNFSIHPELLESRVLG